MEQLVKRIVGALEQLADQCVSIQRGEWKTEGLQPARIICLVITYGHINAATLPFFRRRVRNALIEKGKGDLCFAVLSLEDFDTVIRLAECGEDLDRVAVALADENGTSNVLYEYRDKLPERTLSTYAYERGKVLLDRIRSLPTNHVRREQVR